MIYENYGLGQTFLNVTDKFYAGIECEIECVRSPRENFDIFKATHDGSLRNDGLEFISEPSEKLQLVEGFKKLHARLAFTEVDDPFSPRTSTHVHINCRSLTAGQVKNLIMLYVLYEEFFFAMVKPERRGNIHCVPLSETYLCSFYSKPLDYLRQRWHKYTALNILPLGELGTVEFRHLQGTDDASLLEEWLTTLENLWRIAQRTYVDAAFVSSPEVITATWEQLFGHSARITPLRPNIAAMTQNNLLDVKLSLI
jgi:hypothetical protein